MFKTPKNHHDGCARGFTPDASYKTSHAPPPHLSGVLLHHCWGPYMCGKPYFAFWTNSTDFRGSLGLALDPCLLPPWPFRSNWALMSSCWSEACLVGTSEPPKVSSDATGLVRWVKGPLAQEQGRFPRQINPHLLRL